MITPMKRKGPNFKKREPPKKKAQRQLSPREVQEKYGNVRFIKPTREEAIVRLVKEEQDRKSYSTLPNKHSKRGRPGASPQTDSDQKLSKMPPLNQSMYNSK